MGATVQISTFVQLSQEQDLHRAFGVYDDLLRRIGYVSDEIESVLFHCTWQALEEFGFGGSLPGQPIIAGGEEFWVAPGVLGFGRSQNADGMNWLEVVLYFDEESLRSSSLSYRYRPEIGEGIWTLMRKWSEAFQETGIFLTNEATQGKTWEVLIGDSENQGDLWSFDLALIPRHLDPRFSSVPGSYRAESFSYGLGLARVECWIVLPWQRKSS